MKKIILSFVIFTILFTHFGCTSKNNVSKPKIKTQKCFKYNYNFGVMDSTFEPYYSFLFDKNGNFIEEIYFDKVDTTSYYRYKYDDKNRKIERIDLSKDAYFPMEFYKYNSKNKLSEVTTYYKDKTIFSIEKYNYNDTTLTNIVSYTAEGKLKYKEIYFIDENSKDEKIDRYNDEGKLISSEYRKYKNGIPDETMYVSDNDTTFTKYVIDDDDKIAEIINYAGTNKRFTGKTIFRSKKYKDLKDEYTVFNKLNEPEYTVKTIYTLY